MDRRRRWRGSQDLQVPIEGLPSAQVKIYYFFTHVYGNVRPGVRVSGLSIRDRYEVPDPCKDISKFSRIRYEVPQIQA